MSKTDKNIEKIGNLNQSDRWLTICAITETVGIDKECIRQILHKNFNMQKVCTKILTFEQKEACENICTDTLNVIENDPNFVGRVITCDESWFFTYDPETMCQFMHWKSPSSPRAKNTQMNKSKFKAMMIVFFDIHGIMYLHWVPEDQIVNQHYYLEVFAQLCEKIRKKT